MKTAPKRYHCSSSQAFEAYCGAILRTIALPALTMTATRISHITVLPMHGRDAVDQRAQAPAMVASVVLSLCGQRRS